MKKIAIFLQVCCLFTLFSCDKDEERAVIQPDVAAPTLISPTNNYTKVIEEQDGNELITFVWDEVDYGINTPVGYTLSIDTAGNDFANAVNVGSSNKNSFSMTITQLNDLLLNDLGLTPNEPKALELRVTSKLQSARTLVSDPISLTITPWKADEPEPEPVYPGLWVGGDFDGWNVTNGPEIVSVNDDGVYEGYINLPEGGQFKLYAQAGYEPISYGDGGDGVLIEANYAGANFQAPSAGYYYFVVDINTMTYLLMKTDWGIIGGATPGGWDADTELVYDPENQVWTVTADMKVDGSFKFRANKEWIMDFGIDDEGKLAYANHPWYTYVERPQLTVPEDGNYTITLDLHRPGFYSYKLQKN